MLSFDAVLWRHEGQAAWYFLTVSPDVADALRETSPPRRGFGSIRVRARSGDQTWETSVFPDTKSGSYLLPVKRSVRVALDVDDGDAMHTTITPLHLAG